MSCNLNGLMRGVMDSSSVHRGNGLDVVVLEEVLLWTLRSVSGGCHWKMSRRLASWVRKKVMMYLIRSLR